MAGPVRADSAHPAAKVTSEILDRLPPHNLDAERGVLGSILLDPNLCDEVVLVLRADDFYADAHRKLFAHVVEMHDDGKRIDATLLIERLRQKGDFEAIGGAAYLAEIVHGVPVAAHCLHYARIVRDKAMLRDLIHTSTEILRDAYDPTLEPEELVSRSEERIFAVHDQRAGDQVASINEVLLKAFDEIDRRMQGGAAGVPTGFADLDELTGGLHKSELVILAARPSMGKTALAMNIAEHVAVKAGVPTLFVSLEMSRQELAQRMLCSRGRINGKKFRSGILSAQDRGKLVEASSVLSKAPLYVDDTPSRTITEIAACSRRLKRKQNLGFVVIDYLQLIEPDNPKDPRQEQVAKIARRLKGMARELEVPVLCLAQLNRQAEVAKDSRPKLSHLRESGAIEQDADVVMFIHREDYGLSADEAQEQNAAGKAELIVAKQRNGPVGDVPLIWRKEFTTFENAATKPYDEFVPFDGGF
jgi:replicative DNA helicase